MAGLFMFYLLTCGFFNELYAEQYPPAEIYELIDPLHEMCTGRLGVTDDEVKSYKIENKSPKMMCYMECLMKESNWMSEDGVIQYDVIREFPYPTVRDILQRALTDCMDIKPGTKDCELSYNFNVCLQKADPVHWFLP